LESYNPLANVRAPQQPLGAAQGNPQNPLARLAGQLPGSAPPQQQPAPTTAQATAAVRRLTAVQSAMREVMQSPGYGRTNIRPTLQQAIYRMGSLGARGKRLRQCLMNSPTYPTSDWGAARRQDYSSLPKSMVGAVSKCAKLLRANISLNRLKVSAAIGPWT
jgi:hypothetical protein